MNKDRKSKLILALAFVATVLIISFVLLPTIIAAIFGQAKYYVTREFKFVEKRYNLSSISTDGLEKKEYKVLYSGANDLGIYALVDVGDDDQGMTVELFSSDDNESIGKIGFVDDYATLNVPFLSDEEYYVNLEDPTDTDDEVVEAIINAVNKVKIDDYVESSKKGKTVTFITDDEKLAAYLDALVTEVNKSDAYKAKLNEYVSDGMLSENDDIYLLLSGQKKFADKVTSDVSTYKYIVVYAGRKNIESRELYKDDKCVLKIYENEDKNLVIKTENIALEISNFDIVPSIGRSKLPVFDLSIKGDFEANVSVTATDNSYKFNMTNGNEKTAVSISEVKDITSITVSPKENCKILNDEALTEIYANLFGSMFSFDLDDIGDYEDLTDFDYDEYFSSYFDSDYSFKDEDFDLDSFFEFEY